MSTNRGYVYHLGYEKWDQNSREISDNYRKGTTPKTIATKFSNLEIDIPRDSNSTFEPQLVKKHQRNINDIEEKVIELYSKGLSTREINETFIEMYGVEVNKNLISKIIDKIMPDILSWQNRPLDNLYPIVFMDGIRFKVKEDSKYVEKSIYIIIAINTNGFKEILGFWVSESESAKEWLNIFNDLKSRGVNDILISCSDNLKGLSEAIKSAFPKTIIQKCIVHQIRNSLKFIKYDDKKEFVNDMQNIYKASNLDIALEQLEIFDQKWGKKYGYATKSWKNNIKELTSFFEFPLELRKIIYTTNLIENVNRNIRKITKTKGGFTSTQALIKLVYLRLLNISEKWNIRISSWGIILQQLKILFEDRI